MYMRIAALILASLIIDQATKSWALDTLFPGEPVYLLPFLSLRLGFNEGVSFGILADFMSGRSMVIAFLTAAITVVVIGLAFRSRCILEAGGFSLMAGGSAGNVIDRLRQGAVTDFLEVSWRGWYWPTFNLADVFISSGVVMILITNCSPRWLESK